jgi:hypothetical protein
MVRRWLKLIEDREFDASVEFWTTAYTSQQHWHERMEAVLAGLHKFVS